MIRVEVTEEDIRHGLPCATRLCPVALAVKRCVDLGVGDRVEIGAFTMGLYRSGKLSQGYLMPKKVQVFIRRFDQGKSVKPFSFYLRRTKGGG